MSTSGRARKARTGAYLGRVEQVKKFEVLAMRERNARTGVGRLLFKAHRNLSLTLANRPNLTLTLP